MRIDTTTRTSSTGKSSAASRSGGAMPFVPAGGTQPARVQSAAPIAQATGIDAILALQAVDEPLQGRRKAVRRGKTLLDLLDGIKADLLVGQISADRLDQLANQLADIRERSVPGLDAVLDDIDLRVRVELAKFGRFPPG